MFDPPSIVPYSKITVAENDTEEHRKLTLQAARESIVLLKNKNNLLPLRNKPATIAVIGPNADSLDALLGNYNGKPSKPVTVLEGIRTRFAGSTINYVEGTGLVGPVTKPIPSEALYSDESRTEHGLKGEYFSNIKLEGSPVLVRIDKTIDFAWGDSGISPQLPNNYAVRWTGAFSPPQTGDYLIGFSGQDGYRLWFNGDLIAED